MRGEQVVRLFEGGMWGLAGKLVSVGAELWYFPRGDTAVLVAWRGGEGETRLGVGGGKQACRYRAMLQVSQEKVG